MNIVDCGHDADAQKTDITTGYGTTRDGRKICFACCGEMDRQELINTGKGILYLTTRPNSDIATLSNWPGTLKLVCHVKRGRHNIARYRYDVWFIGPDGKQWHGVQYGDNTQICHVKRNKERR